MVEWRKRCYSLWKKCRNFYFRTPVFEMPTLSMDMIYLETITSSWCKQLLCNWTVVSHLARVESAFFTSAHLMPSWIFDYNNVDNTLVFWLSLVSACRVSECVGLTLDGCQVSINPLYCSLFIENTGKKSTKKCSWVEIRAWGSLTSYHHWQNGLDLGKLM